EDVAANDSIIFLCDDSSVYASYEQGTSWFNKNQNSSLLELSSLLVHDSLIYVGSYYEKGVWYHNIFNFFALIEGVVHQQDKKDFLQFYPNPFHSKVSFVVSNSESEYFDIRMVNVLGREIERVYSGNLEAGNHSFEWNASTLPAGPYFC